MAVRNIRSVTNTTNKIAYNEYNTKHNVNVVLAPGTIYARPSVTTIGEKIIYKNDIKSVPQLTKNNWFIADHYYPFITAVHFNYHIPYLEPNAIRRIYNPPEVFYTIPFSSGVDNITYFQSIHTKIDRSRMQLNPDASEAFIDDMVLDQYFADIAVSSEMQSLQMQNQQFAAQNDELEMQFYYYSSLQGNCPACLIQGGDFLLQGGVSFPDNDGPVDASGGFPLQASSCGGLEGEIDNLNKAYSGTTMIIGYPIEWSYVYKDGTTIGGIIESCDELPDDLVEAYSNFGAASQEECEEQAAKYDTTETYPGIDIYWDNFDTQLITSSSQPSFPMGTPCSDLFGRYI